MGVIVGKKAGQRPVPSTPFVLEPLGIKLLDRQLKGTGVGGFAYLLCGKRLNSITLGPCLPCVLASPTITARP
jgi:hypothetical protein